MENTIFDKMANGVYLLSTHDGGKLNGCIIDTCMQVTHDPKRVAVVVMKSNFTNEMIGKAGVFALSVFDRSVEKDTIARFGYQSGRNADKFAGIDYALDVNGCPYIKWQTCGMLSCKVAGAVDLGTHVMFIGDVVATDMFSNRDAELYSDYQRELNVKMVKQEAAPVADTGKPKYVCDVCGYVYDPAKGDPDGGIAPGTAFEDIPDNWVCPVCHKGKKHFRRV